MKCRFCNASGLDWVRSPCGRHGHEVKDVEKYDPKTGRLLPTAVSFVSLSSQSEVELQCSNSDCDWHYDVLAARFYTPQLIIDCCGDVYADQSDVDPLSTAKVLISSLRCCRCGGVAEVST